MGYLSAVSVLCEEKGLDFDTVFREGGRHYYVHGKDNIPFHTIILPSLLLAHGGGLRLPDDIVSSEYITLDGQKVSTSRNHAVWAKDLVKEYHPDAVRYFFIATIWKKEIPILRCANSKSRTTRNSSARGEIS